MIQLILSVSNKNMRSLKALSLNKERFVSEEEIKSRYKVVYSFHNELGIQFGRKVYCYKIFNSSNWGGLRKYSLRPYGIYTGNYFPKDTLDMWWVYVRDVNLITGIVEYQKAQNRAPWEYMHAREFRKRYYRNNR